MKGSASIIGLLNSQLQLELTTVNQYFLHGSMYKNWGFNSLSKIELDESAEEMKHVQILIDRILFLEGTPKIELGALLIGIDVQECIESDFAIKRVSHETLIPAIAFCEIKRDFISRKLFEQILNDTEEHIDFLETQLEVIKQVGIQNWLQSQI